MSSFEKEAFRQAVAIVSADNSAGTDELAAIASDVVNRKLTTQEMVEILRDHWIVNSASARDNLFHSLP